MDSTDGLRRGEEVINTGGPIKVPVGTKTLGRLFNLLGKPIDEKGDIEVEEYCQSTENLRFNRTRYHYRNLGNRY